MAPEECSAFSVHPPFIVPHPDQMASGVQVAVLGVRNAVQGPLHMTKRHQGVRTIVKNQRRTTDRIWLQPRFAARVEPIVLDARRLLCTPKLGLCDQHDEVTHSWIISKLEHAPTAHVVYEAIGISTQLSHFPSKAKS